MMAHHLNIGIAQYCGVRDSRLELLHNTLGDNISDMPNHIENLVDTARASAVELMNDVQYQQQFSQVR
jgi:hypothetical protein